MIWMWISNVAILLGAEFNAELERGRAVAAGIRPARSLLGITTNASCRRKRSSRGAEGQADPRGRQSA